MSVGDIKGFRRRLKIAERAGHAPRRDRGATVQESIARNRAVAQRMAKAASGKSK